MIVFKKIKYKNFLSTGNAYTTIELNKHKTTLIVGENGAGKSTVLDALTFGLFGKSFRKINKPQLVNSITNSETVVDVEFSVGSTNYRVVRGIKPTVFDIYKNGDLVNQSADSKDYQDILEKQILKINYKSFCQVVVLGSATFLPFMQLPTPQRREIIENLLDLEIFTIMNSLLKDKVLENKEKISECLNNKKIFEEKIKLTKEHIAIIKKNESANLQEKLDEIETSKNTISELNKSLIDLTTSKEDLTKKLKNESKFKEKIQTMLDLKGKIENNIEIIEKDILFFEKNDNCPTCKQTIDDKFKNKTVDEKRTESKQKKDAVEQLKDKIKDIEVKTGEFIQIRNDINDIILQERQTQVKIHSLETYIESLNRDVEKIKTNSNSIQENKIDEYEKELISIESIYNELIKERNVLSASSVLLKDNGIKSKIVKKYIPIINKLINKYLASLNFFVKFELDEEFNEKIKSRHRDEFSYTSFSEGERMRINLAILFTWREISRLRNSINTNILIMDEVFDSSLDSNATEEFLKLINAQDNKSNIFVISHKTDQLTDKFDKVIRFNKVKNFSKLQAKGI